MVFVRQLLLILGLLAFAGQSLATAVQTCGGMTPTISAAEHADMDTVMHGSPCDQEHQRSHCPTDDSSDDVVNPILSGHADCGGSCQCLGGHCTQASAVGATLIRHDFLSLMPSDSWLADLVSNPTLGTLLRPPIYS